MCIWWKCTSRKRHECNATPSGQTVTKSQHADQESQKKIALISNPQKKGTLLSFLWKVKFCLKNCSSKQNWGLSVWVAELDRALLLFVLIYLFYHIVFSSRCMPWIFTLVIVVSWRFYFQRRSAWFASHASLSLNIFWAAAQYCPSRRNFLEPSELMLQRSTLQPL